MSVAGAARTGVASRATRTSARARRHGSTPRAGRRSPAATRHRRDRRRVLQLGRPQGALRDRSRHLRAKRPRERRGRARPRARRGEVLELYAHDPGRTVRVGRPRGRPHGDRRPRAAVLHLRRLRRAAYRPAPASRCRSTTRTSMTGSIAAAISTRYGARVTFFVAATTQLRPEQKAALHELAARRSRRSRRTACSTCARPPTSSRTASARTSPTRRCRRSTPCADGFDVTTYAYPFGARTSEIDARSSSTSRSFAPSRSRGRPVVDPCPQ